MNIRNILITYGHWFMPVFFLVISLAVQYDYGMNWDSPVHFSKGQAFFRYMTTGKTDYSDNPLFCQNEHSLNAQVDYFTGERCDRHRKTRVSEYESTLLDYSWAIKNVYGHPAVNDIMAAALNTVFFKYLGWVEDIQAYHLLSVLSTFMLAVIVASWVRKTNGFLASCIAVLVVYTYPLLAGEQHFNIKDPPMAAFFTASIYFFWRGINEVKVRYIFISAVMAGISMGVKFNFIFAPFIVAPWLLTVLWCRIQSIREKMKKARRGIVSTMAFVYRHTPRRFILAFILYPVIIGTTLYLLWPTLWPAPLERIHTVVSYYQDIGEATCPFAKWTISWLTSCSDPLPFTYFLTTIPVVSLILFFAGFIVLTRRIGDVSYVGLLWILFFLVTLGRAIAPISSLYGGIRLIMEFIAPFAMIAGVGGAYIAEGIGRFMKVSYGYSIGASIVILSFIPISIQLVRLHPNENLYFNWLVGGLEGAEEHQIKGYGNSYGNALFQAVTWINENAKKDAVVAVAFGNAQNISRASLRPDILLANTARSGYFQNGEYQVALNAQFDQNPDLFRYKFLSRYLDPVHVIAVEGVPIATVWNNDKQYVKPGVDLQTEYEIPTTVTYLPTGEVVIALAREYRLKRLELTLPYSSDECINTVKGYSIAIHRKEWSYTMPEQFNNFAVDEIAGYDADSVFLFAEDTADSIAILAPQSASCDLNALTAKVFTFDKP